MYRANLVFISVVACIIGACQGAVVQAEESEAQRNMRLFGGSTRFYVRTMNEDTEVKNDEVAIDEQTVLTGGTQRVAILIHGRDGSPFSEFTNSLINAFLNDDEDIAVVLVDWEMVSKMGYNLAASAVRDVGADLATFIATAEDKGKLNLNNLHIVGFDLGAHVAGYAGRQTGSLVRRITGLDPAGQDWGQYSGRLDSGDALFVEVIHTDGVGNRAFGIGEPIGHLDFFPNGATRQPGCVASNNLCHHNRAWELFAATIDRPGQLFGLKCDSMIQVNNNRCTGTGAIMGTARLQKQERGIYRLVTGRLWPYTV